MSMDRTLKTHGGLTRQRSVLTRAERVARLIDEGKFDPDTDSPFALPKVRVRHSKAGTKTKKAAAEEAPAGEADAAGEAAAGEAAKAAPAKAASPKAAPAKAAGARAEGKKK